MVRSRMRSSTAIKRCALVAHTCAEVCLSAHGQVNIVGRDSDCVKTHRMDGQSGNVDIKDADDIPRQYSVHLLGDCL